MAMEKAGKSQGAALSLWALLARNSIYKILAVLGGMALAELLLFYVVQKSGGNCYTLAAAMEGSHISVVFLAALGLVYFILAWTEGRLDTESSAAMLRLRLSGGRIFMIKAAYNVACILILFIAQIWLGIWLVEIYRKASPEIGASSWHLFLAFYQIDFLHCLLPMAETGKWIRSLLLLLSFGMEAAGGTGKSKRKIYMLAALYALTAVWFVSPMGGNVTDLLGCVIYAIVILSNIWQVWKARGEKL